MNSVAPIPVAVGVCTYRRNEPLRVLLTALVGVAEAAEGRVALAVIVVDDNPDGSAEPVAKEFVDNFELGLHYRHLGSGNISKARNTVLTTGMGLADWVVLTDDDCDPPADWLGSLLDMQEQTEADIVTGPFTLRPVPGTPRWYVDQGFVAESVRYPDGSVPDHGCTANAMIRTDFLRNHTEVRFQDHLGRTGGEDMVFFHTAEQAGAEHRYALQAMMYEDIPLTRTTFKATLRTRFWFGNNQAVINENTGEFPRWRIVGRGVKLIVRAVTDTAQRVVTDHHLYLRRTIGDAAIGVGILAGVFGYRANHH